MVGIPRYADTVIVGGGTSGSVVAGLLAAASDDTVLVLEAGPDYGALADRHWPADLLDARAIADSHDWGYASGATYPDRTVPFERARVIGGCSSHNGCAAIWGHRRDYDDWAAGGLDGWSTEDLLPFFAAVTQRARVRNYAPDEVTPFHRRCLDAAASLGLPLTDNLNDLDENEGMAASPVNIAGGVRWNAALAYLDPVRDRPNLSVVGNAPVDRVVVRDGRAVGVIVLGPSGPTEVRAARVVVSGGAYGSPAILLRSGIGEPEALRSLGIEPKVALRGVGRNLHDHPAVTLQHHGSDGLVSEMRAFAAANWMPEEQTIAKLRSQVYPAGEAGFDLHIYPVGGPDPGSPGGWRWQFPVACMTPRSRGSVVLASADPSAAPLIDHGYLSDPDGHDRAVLVDGVRIARELAAQPSLGAVLGAETRPGPAARSEREVAAWVDASVAHYYHPVGTCAMGTNPDAGAVVDARGRVHGVEGLTVADCSIIPTVPRANTNIPALVVGERIASWLTET